jgi:hypothetical protein
MLPRNQGGFAWTVPVSGTERTAAIPRCKLMSCCVVGEEHDDNRTCSKRVHRDYCCAVALVVRAFSRPRYFRDVPPRREVAQISISLGGPRR